MTNQIQGEILFSGWGGTADDDYAYTPWMPVAGEVGTFGVEVTYRTGATLTWGVQTRTLEDATLTNMITGQTLSAVGVGTAISTTAAKDLVRYRFSTSSTMSVTDYVVVRALAPSWNRDR
jgi:hypothetical protein